MNQETRLFQNRIRDLADRSYQQNRFLFTDFLTLQEQSDVCAIVSELSASAPAFFGGADACERRMLRLGDPETLGYSQEYPIRCLVIEPAAEKFAENLGHRDFLGALMNLGIRREVLGDLFVRDKKACVFCEERISAFLVQELGWVRHTAVRCHLSEMVPEDLQPVLATAELVAPSERADVLIAKVCKLSRSQSVQMFREEKIFVNGRLFENNSGILNKGDVVSVRGFGKFIYDGCRAETRKGNYRLQIRRYI